MDELVWLTHPDTGGINRFAAGAVEAWTARGWVPCDPPPETQDHLRDPAPAPDPAPDPAAENPASAVPESTPETSPRVRRGITSQE